MSTRPSVVVEDSNASIESPTENKILSMPSPLLMSPLKKGQSDFCPIYKFVLTGGPCAGKTTALDRLSTFFRDRGFRVYMVPEAATILQMGGVSVMELQDSEQVMNFQWQVLHSQMTLEDSFYSLAKDTGKPCLILCDRGAMDGSAYMEDEDWEELKGRHDLNNIQLRDTRYIAVFHLVTAAQGAEEFYSLDNNETRTEDVETARIVDKKCLNAWIGHPKLFVFDNSTDFEGKMQRLINTAAKICGLPSTVKTSRKFLLANAPQAVDLPAHHQVFEVEKVYLNPEESNTSKDYSFVRCRSQYGLPAYGMTTVRYLYNNVDDEIGEQVDLKRVLSAREYSYAVRHRADTKRHIIKQNRICFLWKNQSLQIHVYKEPKEVAGLAILHIQASKGEDNVQIPSFLNIEKELTSDIKKYSAYNVSLKSNE